MLGGRLPAGRARDRDDGDRAAPARRERDVPGDKVRVVPHGAPTVLARARRRVRVRARRRRDRRLARVHERRGGRAVPALDVRPDLRGQGARDGDRGAAVDRRAPSRGALRDRRTDTSRCRASRRRALPADARADGARPRPRGPRRVRRPLPRRRRDRRPARGNGRLRDPVHGSASRSRRARSHSASPPAAASSRRRTGTRRTCSRSGAGELVPFADPGALADAVCRYIDEPERTRGRARRGAADRRAAGVAVGRRGDRGRARARPSSWRHAGADRSRASIGSASACGRTICSRSSTTSGSCSTRTASSRTARRGYCVDDVARLAVVALELARRGDEQVWTSILYRSLAFLQDATDADEADAELHGLRPALARRAASRRPRRPLRLGARRDPLHRLGARRRRPDANGCSTTIVATLGPDPSLRTGAYAALGLARLDPDRLAAGGSQRRSSGSLEQLAAAYATHSAAGLALVRGRAHLRQRAAPPRPDRRRRRARPGRSDARPASTALRWLGDESGLADGTLRLTGHRRPRAHRAGSGQRRRAAARRFRLRRGGARRVRRHRRPGARAARAAVVRLVPRPQPAPPAALRLRDRRLQRRARRGDDERQPGCRVDARVPPRGAAARRRRAAGRPPHRAREAADGMTGVEQPTERARALSSAIPRIRS